MAQRIAMGIIFDKILKEATASINQSQKTKIEEEADKRLIRVFGADWSKLPITGPRMMVLVFILNVVLLPVGIVPATLIQIAVAKSREYEIEDKFDQILLSSKLNASESKEKMQELLDYAGQAGSNVKETLIRISEDPESSIGRILKKGKSMFGRILPK